MSQTLGDRFAALPTAGPEGELVLCAGARRDYERLCEHHYRSGPPATFARVLVFRHAAPSIAARFDKAKRDDAASQTVAVLVESMPTLCCAARDRALDNRYGRFSSLRDRARLLNDEVRCISRVIVKPQWRGLGLAVRLVAAALDSATTIHTEALAAMGHVHPFFARAGMQAYPSPRNVHDVRLIAALASVGIAAADLARLEPLIARLRSLPTSERRLVLAELRRWHRRRRPGARRTPSNLRCRLEAAQRNLLCRPVYYLHDNRPR